MGHIAKKKVRAVIGDPSDQRGMAYLMGRYLEWMRVRNYSEATVEARLHQLEGFIKWCEERAVTG
jgi:site-specific recombinase XerD